jgi:uncharacterized delta-60 repeat protein
LYASSRPTTRLGTGKQLAIMFAGALALLGGVTAAARAASPGSLDSSFGSGGIASLGSHVRLLGEAFQSDGKLVVVGQRAVSSGATLIVARLSTAGGLDSSFGGGVVSGPPVGTSPFGTGSIGRGVAVQGDGKIVVVGKATDSSGKGTLGLLVERYNASGSLDTGFGSGGVVNVLTGQFGDGNAVAIQPDGKIVAVGTANAPTGGTFVAVVRLKSNGSLDPSFGSGGTDVINLGTDSLALAVALQGDAKIVIAGSQAPGLQVPNALIARLTPNGALDPSFNGTGAYAHQYAQGAASSAFNALALQSDGKIVAAGAAAHGNTSADALVVRFTAGGAQDPSFGAGGVVYSTSAVNTNVSTGVPGAKGVAIAANGDIVAAGTESNAGLTGIELWAFTPTGASDGSFGASGTTVTGFGSSTNGEANALAIAPDGSLAAAGDSSTPGGAPPAGLVARYLGFSPAPPPPPPPPPPKPPALKLTLQGVSSSDKIASVVKHGLKVSVGCNEACTIRVSLGISAATAKQLKIVTYGRRCFKSHGKRRCVKTHAFRPVTIASGRGTLSKVGIKAIVLKLSRSLDKTLQKQKRVKLSLQVSATSTATHKVRSLSKGLTFKR